MNADGLSRFDRTRGTCGSPVQRGNGGPERRPRLFHTAPLMDGRCTFGVFGGGLVRAGPSRRDRTGGAGDRRGFAADARASPSLRRSDRATVIPERALDHPRSSAVPGIHGYAGTGDPRNSWLAEGSGRTGACCAAASQRAAQPAPAADGRAGLVDQCGWIVDMK